MRKLRLFNRSPASSKRGRYVTDIVTLRIPSGVIIALGPSRTNIVLCTHTMVHRQTYREGPATPTTTTSSASASATNPLHCVRDYDFHDAWDTQQIADESVAFLRIFSQRLQRFKAQVSQFAHVGQPSPQTRRRHQTTIPPRQQSNPLTM